MDARRSIVAGVLARYVEELDEGFLLLLNQSVACCRADDEDAVAGGWWSWRRDRESHHIERHLDLQGFTSAAHP